MKNNQICKKNGKKMNKSPVQLAFIASPQFPIVPGFRASTRSATIVYLTPLSNQLQLQKKLLEGDNLAVCRVNWNLPSHCKPFFEPNFAPESGDTIDQ